MLKLEIKLDDGKINKDKKYQIDSVYKTMEQYFTRFGLRTEYMNDGTVFFYGNGKRQDYGAFGSGITSLREQDWFMEYVVRWIWYNSNDGEDENDFSVEDVLYHYTRKESVA